MRINNQKTFFAASYPYGVGAVDTAGRPLRTVYAFRSRAAAADWAHQGPAYLTASGVRLALRASNVRAVERMSAEAGVL